MKKNNIHLFNTPHKGQKTKISEPVSSLKSDRSLFSRLYVASQFRDVGPVIFRDRGKVAEFAELPT